MRGLECTHNESSGSLITRADLALYARKKEGLNEVDTSMYLDSNQWRAI